VLLSLLLLLDYFRSLIMSFVLLFVLLLLLFVLVLCDVDDFLKQGIAVLCWYFLVALVV